MGDSKIAVVKFTDFDVDGKVVSHLKTDEICNRSRGKEKTTGRNVNGFPSIPLTSQTTQATYSGLTCCPENLNGRMDSGRVSW